MTQLKVPLRQWHSLTLSQFTPTSHRLSDNSKKGMEWPWQTNDIKLPQKKKIFFLTQLEIAFIEAGRFHHPNRERAKMQGLDQHLC